jgi:signal transduction histidine kinase
MSEGEQRFEVEAVPVVELAEALAATRPFARTDARTYLAALGADGQVDRVKAAAGTVLFQSTQSSSAYWVVLEGEIRAERRDDDGARNVLGVARAGEGFGEAPLLLGKSPAQLQVETGKESLLLRFTEEQFWKLMACCPELRNVVRADMKIRLHSYQEEELHREKLVSLGTLAAGLMHELHNPGSAAKRASSQLRENLMRLQELSLRHTSKSKTPLQLECMHNLLMHAFGSCGHTPAMSSLEQADAEEALSEWLQAARVEDAYKIGPSLVAIGFNSEELECAKDAFDASGFSDALTWLDALVSSVSLVCAIEESITRISELVMAVKKFAYDDRSQAKELDVHDSLQSTLTILGHKLRMKQITVDKRFAATPSTIRTKGSALSQVWTNLIDNAMDASPAQGKIEISTWTEACAGDETCPGWLAVSIGDEGSGIPAEVLPHIFEAFFTTKPAGSGTGLGLEIVHRIVTQKFGGTIEVDSKPGATHFVVRLPLRGPGEGVAGTGKEPAKQA